MFLSNKLFLGNWKISRKASIKDERVYINWLP
jgi:hypothetical protein